MVAAPARNIMHSYMTLGSTSLSLSQPCILGHLSLGHNTPLPSRLALGQKTRSNNVFLETLSVSEISIL